MAWAPSESMGAFQKCKRDAPLFCEDRVSSTLCPLRWTVVVSTVRSESFCICWVAYEQNEGRPWQSAPFQDTTEIAGRRCY